MNLAEMLIAFVADIREPALTFIHVICWAVGLWLILWSALRMLRHSDGFDKGAPPALGTMATLVAGVVRLQLPSWLDAATLTIFGTGDLHRTASLSYATADDSPFDGLVGSILDIVSVIGLIAFIRGIFVLRACSDGRPNATAGSAAMHMIGGVAAWHIVAIIDALQTTLGIRVLDI